jgi:hypothetical protein
VLLDGAGAPTPFLAHELDVQLADHAWVNLQKPQPSGEFLSGE